MDSTQREIDYLTEQITAMESRMIDPRDFGRLEAEVHSLRTEVQGLRQDVRALIALADRGRGAVYAVAGLSSMVGAAASWIVGKLA